MHIAEGGHALKMKVYKRFLASYLCVCLVPLLLSLVTICHLERRVQDSIMDKQKSYMQSVRQEIDQGLGDAATTLAAFAESTPASHLAEEGVLSPAQLFELCELRDSLSAVISQNPMFYRGFCYFSRSGFLVTDRRTYHPESASLFAWDLELEPDSFYSLMDGGSPAEHVRTVYKKTGDGWVFVLRSQYDSQSRELLSCVGIVLQLDKSLSAWNTEDLEAFAADDAYQLICGGERAPAACQLMAQNSQAEGSLELDGQRYVFSQYQSGLSGIRYGFLMRQDTYYHEVHIAWLQLILELAVIFVVSVLLAVFWSRRTYRPIKNILPFVSAGPPGPEYRSIEELGSALVSFAQEKESLASQVARSEQQARSAALGQYLLGITKNASVLSQYLEEGQPYQLLAFAPEEGTYGEAFFQKLRECLDEILLDKSGGVSLQFPQCAAVLVQKSLSREDAADIHFAAEQTISLALVCYMSDTYTHLADAPQAWAAIYRALYHDRFWGHSRRRGVWMTNDLPEADSSASYRDFLSRQKALTENLAAGKVQRAAACLKKLIAEDLSDKALPVEDTQRRYADVAELLLPYVEEAQASSILGQFRRYSTAHEMEEALLHLFGQIAWEPNSELSAAKKDLTERVREYIRANYQNPALNASMVADYLEMNLSTLSHQYKAATGSGVLDELHAVRLETAKKLLSQGLSVKETAERTGYVDPRSLIRAFKRYEGITPGQYAKNSASE